MNAFIGRLIWFVTFLHCVASVYGVREEPSTRWLPNVTALVAVGVDGEETGGAGQLVVGDDDRDEHDWAATAVLLLLLLLLISLPLHMTTGISDETICWLSGRRGEGVVAAALAAQRSVRGAGR